MTDDRRSFMRTWAIIIGSVVGLVPALAGLAVFLDPLRSRGKGDNKFIGVGRADMLPADGAPRRFPVVAERTDAWNRGKEPIGSVYVRRVPNSDKLECFTATCPHAGCFVDYDPASNKFKCPCHNSAFTVDGAIVQPSPSPRPMDSLDCKIEGQEILVQFENFYSGKPTKEKVEG